MEPYEFEGLIIRLLFNDKAARERIIPFLDASLFDEYEHKEIVNSSLKFNNEYRKFPTIPELKIAIKEKKVYDSLVGLLGKEIDIDPEFVKNELEGYIKDKLLWNEIYKTTEGLKSQNEEIKNSSADRIQNALAFSFDTSIGLDITNEVEKIYDSLHDQDKVVSTGIKSIDEQIKGGFHEKTLTLFLGECVTEDTEIEIRSRTIDEWKYETIKISEIKDLLKKHDIEVTSPEGWVPVTKYVEKGKKIIFNIDVDGRKLQCSGKHYFWTNIGWVYARDLDNKKHKILCDDEKYHSFCIEKTNIKKPIVDITVNHPKHRYYTNGIASKNTNIGKTATKCALAANCLLQNKNVLYVTLEMSEEKISERIIANIFDTNINTLESIPKDRFIHKFNEVKKNLKGQFIVKEYPASTVNTNRIRALLKELEVKKKFKPDIVFLDMVDVMLPNRLNRGSNTNTELKTICQEIRGLATETGYPFVSSRQITRSGFGGAEIDLTNTAESIGTTTVADIIYGITQTDELREARKFCFILLKNRYGLNKLKCLVNINYSRMRLSDDSEDDEVKDNQRKSFAVVDDAAVSVIKKIKNNKKTDIKNIIDMGDDE